MILLATSRNLSNTTFKFLAVLVWILTLSARRVNAECFDQLKTSGTGIIKSPNNGNEYGKEANCSWNFNVAEPGERGNILTLTVVKLKTYFIITNEGKYCPGSYILAINGEETKCDAVIRNADLQNSYCYEFYTSSCPYIPTSNCKYSEQTSFPVSVTYFSDGRTNSRTDNKTSGNMGFVINYRYTQCSSVGDVNITGGSGHIQSPNYGNEYGKKANSLWKFYPPSDGREYMLLLNVTNMKNHFVISTGEAVCAGSELEINGVPTACRLIDDTRWYSDHCYQFRFSSNCPTELTSRCDHSFLTSFPINVTYFSDGRTDSRVNLSREYTISRGFKINYNYILCPPDTTSESLTVSTQTNAVESLPARSTSTEQDKTTPAPPRKQNLAPIIAGAAGGGVLLLVVLVVVVVCVIRKRNSGKEDNHGSGFELTQQQNQEDAPLTPSPDEANTQPIDAYATVGGATSINGTSNAMYVSINEDGPNASNGQYATVGRVESPPIGGGVAPITEGRATQTTGTDMYATVSKPNLVGVPTTEGVAMSITGSDMYATVSKSSVVTVPTTEGVATSITGTDMYATVSKPSVKVQKLTESSNALYSAVQKDGRNKGTVHYNKTTVDNVLYGSAT